MKSKSCTMFSVFFDLLIEQDTDLFYTFLFSSHDVLTFTNKPFSVPFLFFRYILFFGDIVKNKRLSG